MKTSFNSINNVAIIGGTHGNELTGVELVKYFDQNPNLIERNTLNIKTLLANLNAIKLCRRYDEKDLNRCFKEVDLRSESSTFYEEKRAKEIEAFLGGRNSPEKQDLIIDIHNSTAEMKYSLIFGVIDDYSKKLYAYLTSIEPEVRLYFMPEPERAKSPYLPSIGTRDICLEIGAQAHGTLIGKLFEGAKKLVLEILDFSEAYNLNMGDLSATKFDKKLKVPIFEHLFNLDFPRKENGELAGYIHPNIQGKDYEKVKVGEPIFRLFDGTEILWDGRAGLDEIYPVFINENAYYEKGMAMSLTAKKEFFNEQ